MSAASLSSRAILGRLFERLEAGATGWVNDLSLFVESDQASEEHRWLGMTPAFREWLGGRNVLGLRDQGITILNKSWELTLGIPINDIRRDKTAQVMARVDEMAERANQHGADLLSTLMIDGESTVCYDGQYFFDTDHSEGDSGTLDNDISVDISEVPVATHGSTTAPSPAEAGQVVMKAISQIYGFKDDQGKPLNMGARSFLVMAPVALFAPFATGIFSPFLSAGEVNPLNNMRAASGLVIDLVANPYLTWTTKVAVFRRDGTAKPFIRQEERPLEVKTQAEGSPEEFNNDRWLFGMNYNGNFGYGLWQHACLATMA